MGYTRVIRRAPRRYRRKRVIRRKAYRRRMRSKKTYDQMNVIMDSQQPMPFATASNTAEVVVNWAAVGARADTALT